MRKFQNPGEFAAYLYEKTALLVEAEALAFDKIGKLVAKDAKQRIGAYQDEAGEFPAWRDLADATLADKAAKGYPVPSPLLREGDMRDSVEFSRSSDRVVIGSPSEVALWQELGTHGPRAGDDGYHVPPRPFLGPALFTNEKTCITILGEEIAVWLSGVRSNRW